MALNQPKTLRAHRPPPQRRDEHERASSHQAGHYAGIHPEDRPYHTTQSRTRHPMPIPYQDEDEVYAQARMPTVVKKYNRQPVPMQTHVTEETGRARIAPMRFLLIAIGIILLAFTFAIMLVVYINPALSRWNDDRAYGYPRTTHARAIVGHGTTQHPYSDFTGENINGYMYVVEIEETDPSEKVAHVYFVTRYTGQNKDLIAITSISFADENGDGKLDMLITMENGSLFVLYNDETAFSAVPPKK